MSPIYTALLWLLLIVMALGGLRLLYIAIEIGDVQRKQQRRMDAPRRGWAADGSDDEVGHP